MSRGGDSKEFFEVFVPPQQKAEDTSKKEEKPKSKQPEQEDKSSQPKSGIPEERKGVHQHTKAADPLGWIKDKRADNGIQIPEERGTQGEQGTASPYVSPTQKKQRFLLKDEVIIRQETLIIGAIAAAFLSIVCFFIGYKVGYNKALAPKEDEIAGLLTQDARKSPFGQTGLDIQKDVPVEEPALKVEQAKAEPPKPIIKDKWTLRIISYHNTKENVEKAKEVAGKIKEMTGYDTFIATSGKELFICAGEFEESDSTRLSTAQKIISNLEYENKKPFKGCYPVRIK